MLKNVFLHNDSRRRFRLSCTTWPLRPSTADSESPIATSEAPGPLAVVTGGTGFIGSHLVDQLLSCGTRVRLLARHSAPIVAAHGSRIEVKWGDIRDREAVLQALEGADVVYHLAGYAKAWARDEWEYQSINADGTANVCHAARRCGVRRMVHMSTALLALPAESSLTVDFSRTAYQRSKARAEAIAFDYVGSGGGAVIVRPSRTYGPGLLSQSNSVTRLIDLYSRGRFRTRIQDGNARANYVYVRDVVDGLIAAAHRGVDGSAYVLGGANRTMPEFLSDIAAVTGRRHAVGSIPPILVKVVALGNEAAAHLGVEPLITREWADLLRVDWPVSSEPACREIGYAPRPVVEGLRRTLTWLRGVRSVPFEAL